MLKEFRDFAMRGNVVDMAVGIIIGASFGTIVKSMVDDIIMPPVGLLLGGIDFTNIFLTLKGESFPSLEQAKEAGAVTLNVGVFLNSVITFAIVAFCVFVLIKAMNRLKAQSDAAPADEKPAPPPRSEVLLEEIRDALVKK
jgi:large conductance mechanosensitive channel